MCGRSTGLTSPIFGPGSLPHTGKFGRGSVCAMPVGHDEVAVRIGIVPRSATARTISLAARSEKRSQSGDRLTKNLQALKNRL